jgi:hypothetical protein
MSQQHEEAIEKLVYFIEMAQNVCKRVKLNPKNIHNINYILSCLCSDQFLGTGKSEVSISKKPRINLKEDMASLVSHFGNK